MPAPIRIVQLTDLHFRGAMPGTSEIATRRSREIPALLDQFDALLPGLNADLVAVTGDLLHAPYGLYRGSNPFEMEVFDESVLEDYRALKARFDRWGVPYIALPGNHDDTPRFTSVFGPSREISLCGYRIVSFHDREGPGNVPFRGEAERARLRTVLTDADTSPQIHLQHYVMFPQVEHPYPHNYGDSAELLEILSGSDRVKLSIAGHFHPGSPPVPHAQTQHMIGRAVCEAPHPITVIEIDADGVISTREVLLDPPLREKGHVAVVSRDTLMPPHANPHDPGAIHVPADIAALASRGLVVCTSDLGHPALAGMGWPELADWHDRLHHALAEKGLVLDGLYYSTRHSLGSPEAAGVPRIAVHADQSLLDRVEREFRLTGLTYTTSNH